MRRLHVVAKHEIFVASGRYVYDRGEGQPSVTEHWTIHEVGGGAQFVRVDIDGRDVEGHSVLMEALRAPDGRFERVDRHAYQAQQSQASVTQAVFHDDSVEITGQQPDNLQLVALNPRKTVWFGSWILLGFAVAMADHIIAWGAEEADWSNVEVLGSETVALAGRDYEARRCRVGAGYTLWLDEKDVALRAESGAGIVRLSQYARRPEVKKR